MRLETSPPISLTLEISGVGMRCTIESSSCIHSISSVSIRVCNVESATVTVLRSFLALMLAMMVVRLQQLFGGYEDARGDSHVFCEYITTRTSERSRSAVAVWIGEYSHHTPPPSSRSHPHLIRCPSVGRRTGTAAASAAYESIISRSGTAEIPWGGLRVFCARVDGARCL